MNFLIKLLFKSNFPVKISSTLGVLLIAFIIFSVASSCSKVGEHAPSPIEVPVHPISKPNIILIVTDDVGYDVPNYTGGQSFSTPNMDRMAQSGKQFTQCNGSPLCSPSRFMIMTGKYNFRNYDLWGRMDTSNKSIANMLQDVGYNTCLAGKWQLDGGDASIRALGFNKYRCVEAFYKQGSEEDSGQVGKGLYKNPTIYENGQYWPASQTEGKYSEDLFREYMFNFIDENKNSPFFILWTPSLIHKPFSPTPDDPEFAVWNPDKRPTDDDTAFVPSMVRYQDKELGLLLDKIKSAGVEQNTVIIYIGDNGTPGGITTKFQGRYLPGAKGETTTWSTHVPLLVYWPGTVRPGSVDGSLVDFTDFLPTLAGLSNIPTPQTYGILDGTSFSPQIFGEISTPREYIFCHFNPQPDEGKIPKRWVQDSIYKRYSKGGYFFNIRLDEFEQHPIPEDSMTAEEQYKYFQYKQILEGYH